MTRIPIILLLILTGHIPCISGEITGKIVAVHDGDTVTLLADKLPIKVKLEGIDSPELKQDFGKSAKQALSKLVFSRTVKVVEIGKDQYGRTLGSIYVGSSWVNLIMVQEGMAWVYLKYSHDPQLLAAEEKARTGKNGLWRNTKQAAPWDWRRDKSLR